MKSCLLQSVLLLLLVAATASAGQKFAVASGLWDATSTWSTTRGGTSGAATPTATDTVYIPAPFMVTLGASGKPCYNLVIETGAALISDTRNPNSNQRYIRVSGDSVVNNGIIGYDPAKGPDSTTSICFETYAADKAVTFKGTGISRISRIRPGSNLNNTTAIIDQNMTLTYTGSSGTGGVGWYGANGTSTGSKLVVNKGDTLTLLDQCYIATNSSPDTDGPSTTIQIDGALLMSGPNCTMSLRPAAGAVVSLIVNGTLDIGRTLRPIGTTGLTSSITVNAGGVMKVGASGLGITYFNNPMQTVTGAGTFQFAGGTMHIAAAAGLDSAGGPVRTATRTFASNAGYTFLASAPGVSFTGPELPATVSFLTVADSNGSLSLTKNLTIDSALTLNMGKLINIGKSLIVKGIAVSNNAGAFVDGNMTVPVSATGTKTWVVGQGTESLPISASFSGFTGGDNLTVASVSRTITPPAGGLTNMNKVLDRYYHITKGGLLAATTIDSLVLSYSQLDVAAQNAAEDSLRVYTNTGTGFNMEAIARRDTARNILVTSRSQGPTSGAQVIDIVITGAAMTPVPVLSIKAARAAGAGATVDFEGIATRVKGNYTYMQDTSAGIVLYMASGPYKDSVNSGGIKAGDKIHIRGKLSIYNSLYEVVAADLVGFQRVSRNNPLPTPALLTLKDIVTNGSPYQAMIVKVIGITVVTTDAIYFPARTYSITDKTDTTKAVALRIGNATDTDADSLAMIKLVTFTGPLGQFSSSDPTKGFQLMPVLSTDISDNALAVETLPMAVPTTYTLDHNYPNPFNPSTTIQFGLPARSTVRLSVFNALGQEVAELVNGDLDAGYHAIRFDASSLASGVYFYRLKADNFVETKRLLLLR
jgi:hypothetical protein